MLALVVTAPPSAEEAEDALENAERSNRHAEEVARQTLAGTAAAAAAVAGAAGAGGMPCSDSGKDFTMGMFENICQLMPVGVGCCDSKGCWLSSSVEQGAHRSSFWLKGVCTPREQVDSACSSVCGSKE